MAYLTRIVHCGMNLLGLLEMFALTGALVGVTAFLDDIPQSLRLLPLVLASGVIVAFDIWWRRRQLDFGRRARLFSPFAGGCFVYLPIWLLFQVLTVVGMIIILITHA